MIFYWDGPTSRQVSLSFVVSLWDSHFETEIQQTLEKPLRNRGLTNFGKATLKQRSNKLWNRGPTNFETEVQQTLKQRSNKLWNKGPTNFGTEIQKTLEQRSKKSWNRGPTNFETEVQQTLEQRSLDQKTLKLHYILFHIISYFAFHIISYYFIIRTTWKGWRIKQSCLLLWNDVLRAFLATFARCVPRHSTC